MKVVVTKLPAIGICDELMSITVDVIDETGRSHYLGRLTSELELIGELILILILGTNICHADMEVKTWTLPQSS